MKIAFVAGFAPIVKDMDESAKFYRDGCGLPLPVGNYVSTEALPGLKHFGLWKLSDAAQSCFGTSEWPTHLPVPQGCLEFDVETAEDLTPATSELVAKGYKVLTGPKSEPWGQLVTRLLSPEGLLVGITYTPWMHQAKT